MDNQFFTIAAQLHSFPPLVDRLGIQRVVRICRQAAQAGGVEILIPGGVEIPSLYHALTDPVTRPVRRVYLWFPALADFPGFRSDLRTINDLRAPSPGWGGSATQEEIGETFEFACPNHPDTAGVVLAELERQLREYPFDGVFLDKIRFPSPANGIDGLLTCFCAHCRAQAAAENLDLDAVKALLGRLRSGGAAALLHLPASTEHPDSAQQDWLDELVADQPLLQHFLGFRAASVTRFAAQLASLASSLGRDVALDLFSAGLGLLVGQEYGALAGLSSWIKPMSYRFANGPAGLRHELPMLMQGMAGLLKLPLAQVEAWTGERAAGLAGLSAGDIERDGVPLDLIAAETRRAVDLAGETPIYMGIEAVTIPAFKIRTPPEYVSLAVDTVQRCGAEGAVLSWDLLNMPLANLRAARRA